MPGAGAVDETARQVGHQIGAVENLHPARIRHVGHVRDLDVLFGAIAFEGRLVGGGDNHRHTLLRLADGEFHGIEAAVFGRDAVEMDLEAVGEFADGHAHAARAEVVRLLDEPGHFRTAEQALQFAFFRRITLLDFAAAGGQRSVGVAFRRAGGAADAVTAGAAAEHQDHVARLRPLAQHLPLRHRAHHGADLHPLGRIARMVDFPHVRGCQSDLVAVARIAGRGLARNHPLRQLAVHRLAHRLPDVAGAGHAHRLIHVGAARERVADGAAQAGRSPAERLDFRGMVVGLILELQEPFFGFPVHVHVDDDAAGVVFLALLLVIQDSFVLQIAGADGSQLHQAEGFVFAAEFAPDFLQLRQIGL